MNRRGWMRVLCCGAIVGCAVSGPDAGEPIAAATPEATREEARAAASTPTPPRLRLPDTARPTRYALVLTVVPEKDTFNGTAAIDIVLREATRLLWINATALAIDEAALKLPDNSRHPARVVPGGTDFVGLAFERPVGPGAATLSVTYTGTLDRTATRGLFKQKEGEDWYVFSQFEATHARKAFPSFDEPHLKVPFQLVLRVKKEHVALSNTRTLSETPQPGGMKLVRFAETEPLPTYLVALAVGPFDVLKAGKIGEKKTPFRVVTPRGKANEARYAAQITPDLLSRMEAYFGTPYPYDKLDLLAIPQTVAFGAMENPGLITFTQARLLSSPDDLTVGQKRGLARTTAHELAHQWFGNLVTPVYWDDIWLNESFATWMGGKIVDVWKPEWDGAVERVGSRSRAMGSDSLISARKIRQPIETQDDIENAFDGITYAKGAAVLSMFEAWMGEDRFRAGVNAYLGAHAHGNASAEDFLAALAKSGGGEVASSFPTFLDQAGVPLVSVDLKCEPGAPSRLELTQRRYLPAGSRGSPDQLWRVPVCVRYDGPETETRTCMLLTKKSASVVLDPGGHCPAWVQANDGMRGYYRVSYGGDLLGRLLRDGGAALPLAERVGVLDDVHALARSGEISIAEALALVPDLAADPSRHVTSRAARIVRALGDHQVPEELRSNYIRFIRRSFGERAAALGFTASPGEDDDVKLLRGDIVPLVAEEGEDKKLREAARQLASRWFEDRKAVDADMIGDVLAVAATDGDRAFFDRLRSEAKKTSNRRERRQMLVALGSFRNPELCEEALSIVMGEEFDIREATTILLRALGDSATRERAYAFVKRNFDALAERVPRESAAGLFRVGSAFCDEAHRADVAAFFGERVSRFPGAPRNLAETLEAIDLCIANKALHEPSVIAFLSRY